LQDLADGYSETLKSFSISKVSEKLEVKLTFMRIYRKKFESLLWYF